MVRMNNFIKVNILILILLVPVLIMYMYSNRTSIGVLEQNIRDSQTTRLAYLYKQLDDNVRQISLMANVLLKDPNVKEFRDADLYGNDMTYDLLKNVQVISQKLNLQSVANTFTNSITIYAPRIQKAIGQYSLVYYDWNDIGTHASPKWQYDRTNGQFVLYAFDPINEHRLVENAGLIAKVGFSSSNIVKLLDNNHSGGEGGTFLYNPADSAAIPSGSAFSIAQDIRNEIRNWQLTDQGYGTIAIGKANYLVNYVKSEELGWYLLDFVPMQDILSPITANRRFFFLFLGIMLCVSVLISYILYQNIRMPIKDLIRGVHQLKKGNYAARIQVKSDNEFTFLFQRFNEMAEEIENLVGKVYAEQIRSREATLKQLQSQINPHFLYNCLAFMKSMAVLDEKQAIIAMSVSLSKYYRYTTRNERQLVTVRAEMELVENYLRIQGLQMKRLSVHVELPEDLLELEIPRLLIQPVVENAIIHGIEPHAEAGQLIIRGEQRDGENYISVEDDGPSLTEVQRLALAKKINLPLTDEIGCGLWNVHQRLRYQFDSNAGLQFDVSSAGGLKVILHWR
ncbi:sensor histidine kinase [Paenibacillus nasutitermitis]|uniref:Sensor histidine kinase YesM n=1 Tax=Paenibacillus nasutitermitis TaxID=1652958 RepID=A0A916YKC3_9BACL|nr:histidine kinase [Paenibacillus nasutitermitis]GGD49318.1 sensor histidine kinase YesM [Paenibacillus nasutitermitis]